jgi:hypothetical protein
VVSRGDRWAVGHASTVLVALPPLLIADRPAVYVERLFGEYSTANLSACFDVGLGLVTVPAERLSLAEPQRRPWVSLPADSLDMVGNLSRPYGPPAKALLA